METVEESKVPLRGDDRRDLGVDDPVVTDGGNYVIDAHAKRIPAPEALAAALKSITGVVDHGLFLGLARTVILGKDKGADIREL